MEIEIWTDGACRGNGKKEAIGGWAYAIVIDGKVMHTEANGVQNTTNNQMELAAVTNGILALNHIFERITTIDQSDLMLDITNATDIVIYSDSAYFQRCWAEQWYKRWQKNGWVTADRKPVKNREMWEWLIPYFENPRFTFKKVKGHAGNEFNELVDKLATEAADKLKEELR